MKKFLTTSFLLLFSLTSSLSLAAGKTITLTIAGMNCPSCPYMVERSLSTVEDVQSASAVLVIRKAEVIHDDAIASVDEILGATAAIGYESTRVATGEGS